MLRLRLFFLLRLLLCVCTPLVSWSRLLLSLLILIWLLLRQGIWLLVMRHSHLYSLVRLLFLHLHRVVLLLHPLLLLFWMLLGSVGAAAAWHGVPCWHGVP